MWCDTPIKLLTKAMNIRSLRATTMRLLKPLLPSEMVSFADYYELTWIETSIIDAMFSSRMWNQHDGVLSGWKMPQCFPFFTVLWPPSGYVPVKDVKITKHFIADSHEPQQRKWKLLDEKFQNPIDRYGDFKLLDFLSYAGNVIQSNKLSCELVVVQSV